MARTNTGSTANWLSSAVAPVTAAPLTLAGWINPANLTSDQNIIAINVGGSNYFSILFDGSNAYGLTDNSCVFDVSDAGGFSAIQSPALRTDEQNKWIHCAGVAASATSRIAYLNGRGGSTNTTSKTPAGVNKIDVGAYRDSNTATTFSPLNGSIGEIGVWNVALTPAEIALLANGANPRDVRGANLVAYWPLRGTSLVQNRGATALSINGTMGITPVDPPVRPPRRPARDPVKAASGANFTFDASGGISFAGAATTAFTRNYAASASGGLTFGGVAGAVEANDYTFSASGGLTFAGAATAIEANDYVASGSGGIVFGGAASTQLDVGFTFSASGGLTFDGSATAIEANDYVASGSGGLTFAGAATAIEANDYSATGSGGVVFGGAAAAQADAGFVVAGAGGIAFDGSAAAVEFNNYVAAASGGVLFAGAALVESTVAGAAADFNRRRQIVRRSR